MPQALQAEFLKTSDLARRFNVTKTTVRNWIKAGKLPASRSSGQYRISETDLASFSAPSNKETPVIKT